MAKWKLDKLPEGRKPLPDEWFAERAQMQERIKELEAKLEECLECNEEFSIEAKILKARIGTQAVRDLEAKLAKAVEALSAIEGWTNNPEIEEFARTTLAELTGGKRCMTT